MPNEFPDRGRSLPQCNPDVSAVPDDPQLTFTLTGVYDDLRKLAARHLERERTGHTLQPTALVNEAYMRLVKNKAPIADRITLFAMFACEIRRILVDHARSRNAIKRGGPGARRYALDASVLLALDKSIDLIDLDDVLQSLAEIDPRASKVVELRFFGGLTDEEVAGALGVSKSTVQSDWRVARAWLRRALAH